MDNYVCWSKGVQGSMESLLSKVLHESEERQLIEEDLTEINKHIFTTLTESEQ